MSGVVALGGGHGLARVLRALRAARVAPTALVTVADDGGSSGRLRRDLQIIAPGDLRMALLALAREEELAAALAHRFTQGQLQGHALGNLLLVALAEQHGGFLEALEAAGRLLDCAGRVLPSTTERIALCAQVAGARVDGQASITRAAGQVERVWLEPSDPPGCPEALAAIDDADVVVLGPGSLYTSVIANLLVPEVGAAVAKTPARLVYIANLRTQAGETAGLDAAAHVEAVRAHLDGRPLDTVVLHDGPVSRTGGASPLGVSLPPGAALEVVRADLAEREGGAAGVAHDHGALAAVLASVLGKAALGA